MTMSHTEERQSVRSGFLAQTKNYALKALVVAMLAVPASVARAEAVVNALVELLVDGGNNFAWQKVELPNAKCGNGSQYKFWIHKTQSPNLLMLFEGGGACWDYETCSGRAGKLGAANPNGLADDYMSSIKAKYASPVANGADPGLPFRSRTDLVTKNWNIVYMPYCTGDVHVGNSVTTYSDPTGQQPPLTFYHSGFFNTTAATEYAKTQFPNIQKLLVTGYSAGGTASSAAYYFIRNILNPRQGYFLNDSGPIFFAPNVNDASKALHNRIRSAWNLDPIFARLPAPFVVSDLGSINGMLATQFPQDRFAYTGYSRDYNYSRFSYERFRTPNDKESVLRLWKSDQDVYLANLSRHSNYSYFVPFERQLNDSHCSTVITFVGSHACQQMEKKRRWYEYLEFPWGQNYKCYSEFVGMDKFLERFINENKQVRIVEPPNGYNADDPGMKIIAPIINAAM
jgi:Pectinacetylesterase